MKKIYNIILTVTALLAFAPFAGAQTYGQYSIKGQIKDPVDGSLIEFPKDNGLQGNTDFAYSKNVSAPFDDGTYWIKLESYATGSASRIEAAAPADIVLVLDLSSSMNGARTVIDGYEAATTPSGGWTFNNIGGNGNNDVATTYYYYYEVDDNYHLVYKDREGQNPRRTYRLYFIDDNDNRHYLAGNTIQDNSYEVSGTDIAIYSGTLYSIASHSETRLDALKRATKAFIDQIEKNDKYEDEAGTVARTTRLGNRISLITFNSSATTHNTLAEGYLKDAEGGSPSTAEYLKGLVEGFTTVTGTTPYNGFVAANAQLATIDASRMAAASRTVVFFTDGEPYDSGDRYKAVGEALKTKSKDDPETTNVVEGYDATVFSVGLFSSSPTSGGATWRFLNYTSSNAPNATDYNTPGDGWNENAGFYYDASDASVDLTKVFTDIASQSGGTSSSLSAASSNVDAVSSSFMLPSDITASTVSDKVKIFIAKVNDTETKNNGGTLVFDEEILKGHLPSDWTFAPLDENGAVIPNVDPKMADDGITISLMGDNGIKVKGFDYSSCFCGPIYEDDYEPTGTDADKSHVDHYQGYKIIIMIPIEANPDAVGGPNVDTNAPGSGIYITDGDQTAFVSYKSPTVSLPYNFFIKKSGLRPGESAKFKLERAYIPVDDDGNEVPGWTPEDIAEEDWHYVSTIFVTQPQGASATNEPMVKVRGLPSTSDDGDYVYRISEEKWTWSYHRDAPQYTVKSKINNPFNFSNDKKEDIDIKVRHAESKATNIFNGTSTGNKVYDDSKPRKTTPSESK
ncbi:MAG: VWA domain-containing protein [Bacteroidales bacterium]|nr:VWA domain-containing protein [Bacteroidales bacterium]